MRLESGILASFTGILPVIVDSELLLKRHFGLFAQLDVNIGHTNAASAFQQSFCELFTEALSGAGHNRSFAIYVEHDLGKERDLLSKLNE